MRTTIFPANFEQLDSIRDFVAAAARECGMGGKDVYSVCLAVDEAASNIIEHAYGGAAEAVIEITCEVAEGELTVILRDHGEPFDPSLVPPLDVTADLKDREIGGLGMFLMRKMMNKVNFESSPETGNVLTMVKRLSKPRRIDERGEKPDWPIVFRLGEAILGAPTFADQCDLILESARRLVSGDVSLWLDESLFRLPDWTEERLFDPQPPTVVMRRAYRLRRIARSARDGWAMAIPIQNRETVLGVLQVRSEAGNPLRKRERDFLEGLASHAAVALVGSHRISVERFRIGQLSLVRTVGAQIANVFDVDELARRVTRLIQLTFKYYYVAIFTLEPGLKTLKFRASAGAVARRKGRPSPVLEVMVGEGMIGTVADTGQEILANDVSKEKHYRHIISLPETMSELTIPIKIENRVLGVLDVQSDQNNAFHPYDQLVLRALADNIAMAIEGARLYSSLHRRAEHLELVADVGRAVTSILDLREMMEKVAELVHDRIGFPYVHLFTVHPNRRQIHYEAGSGEKSRALEDYVIDLDDPDGIIPWVARTGEAILANDVSQEPHYRPSPFPPANTEAELCFPLVFNNQVLGVLDIQSDRPNAFTEEDRLLFKALSDSIATAIHNADLYRTEQWRRQVADSLREVAGLLSAHANLDQVLEAILTELERNLPSDVSAIWLLGDEDIYCAAAHGARPVDLETVRHSYQEADAWLVNALLARQPLIRKTGDLMEPSALAGGLDPVHSAIGAPLRIGDQAVGVLTLVHHTPGRYGHEAQAVTATFASYAAVAIENARLYDSAQEQAYASAALLQVAQAVASLSELDDILAVIVRTLPILVGVERAALYCYNAELDEFVPSRQYGLPDAVLPILWHPIKRSDFPLLSAAVGSGQPVLSVEAHRGPGEWLNLRQPSAADLPYLLQSDDRLLMAFPLVIKDVVYGVLFVEEALGSRRFRNRRIEILTGVAQQAALAIQNDLYLQESRTHERLETEVQLARQIQQTFIPETLPTHPSWDLASRWETARQVGGDFFDVMELPDGRIGLFIADVADKGVPAALFMVLTRTLVRAAISETVSPAEALGRVNRLLYPDTQQGMFVTAVYGVIDTGTGEFTYANAGHNPPYWLHAGKIDRLTRTGMALGVLENVEMTHRIIKLGKGDLLLLYTDGITEAFSPGGEMFGEDRLREVVLAVQDKSAKEVLDAVENVTIEFMGSNPAEDDLTMIAAKRLDD